MLLHLGVINDPTNYLSGQSFTVILALIYGYIPYFILPLYASLDRIDRSHLEAARDLGASPFRTFLHVTLPLSKTGLLGGAVLITLPMFGDYYTPNIVSGAPHHVDDRQPDRPLLPRRPAADHRRRPHHHPVAVPGGADGLLHVDDPPAHRRSCRQ